MRTAVIGERVASAQNACTQAWRRRVRKRWLQCNEDHEIPCTPHAFVPRMAHQRHCFASLWQRREWKSGEVRKQVPGPMWESEMERIPPLKPAVVNLPAPHVGASVFLGLWVLMREDGLQERRGCVKRERVQSGKEEANTPALPALPTSSEALDRVYQRTRKRSRICLEITATWPSLGFQLGNCLFPQKRGIGVLIAFISS